MNLVDRVLQQFTFVRRLQRHIRRLEERIAFLEREVEGAGKFVRPGHFYSPIPSPGEITAFFEQVHPRTPFAGVALHEEEQIALLKQLAATYAECPFPVHATPGYRYHLDNPSYGAHDGTILHGMLRHLRPRRIIEVGSGFSSAAMLDLNERAFGGEIALTFIDPDMGRLRPLLRSGEAASLTLLEKRVQEVSVEVFRTLERNDVLFIDSSHVSKVGSDVNWLFFHVLPALQEGVHIHIHDVSSDFEYPRAWLDEGRAWNEQYLLHAFLMYNTDFRVVLLSPWLVDTQNAFLREHMPHAASSGGQIWLRRERIS